MWNAIQLIGSPLALIAFIVAVIATLYRNHLNSELKKFQNLPEDKRVEFLTRIKETYHIENDNLTRQQKFELMMKVLENRGRQLKIILRTAIVIIFIIAFSVVIVLTVSFLTNRGFSTESPNVLIKQVKEDKKDGLYLTRILSPPGSESEPSKSTIWLTAQGKEIYYIDSITITHHSGQLCSIGSGTQLPDAQYSFFFSYGQLQTYTLYPALRIDPNDERELSFTLGLAPSGDFPSIGGFVTAVLNYHTRTGIEGSLLLSEPSEDGVLLSELLDEVIRIPLFFQNSKPIFQEITPDGLHRGVEPKRKYVITYEKLEMPFLSDYLSHLSTSPVQVSGYESRKLLNDVIIKKNKVQKILDLINSNYPIGFDLCSGLNVNECVEGLFKAMPSQEASQALSIHHIIYPSESLAEFINRKPTAKWKDYIEPIAIALILKRKGDWEQALINLAKIDSEILNHINLLRSKFLPKYHYEIKKMCLANLREAYPESGAVKYLMWNNSNFREIERLLLETTPKVENFNNCFSNRTSMAKELIGTELLSKSLGMSIVWNEGYTEQSNFLENKDAINEYYINDIPDIKSLDIASQLEPKMVKKLFQLSEERCRLWVCIEAKKLENELIKIAKENEYSGILSIELLAHSNSDISNEALKDLILDPKKESAALFSLAFQHYRRPSGTLADALLKLASIKKYSIKHIEAIAALWANPVGNWDKALLETALATENGDFAWNALYSLRAKISRKVLDTIKVYCMRSLKENRIHRNLSCIVQFALWLNIPLDFIKQSVYELADNFNNNSNKSFYGEEEIFNAKKLIREFQLACH